MTARATKSIGPYTGVSHEFARTFYTQGGSRTFRIAVYGAYSAGGLVESSRNGIVILDEDRDAVLSDEIAVTAGGWFGPTQNQLTLFESLKLCSWRIFRTLVNEHPQSRYAL